MADYLKIALEVAKIVSPLSAGIIGGMASAGTSVAAASDKGMEDLKVEVEKQMLRMKFEEHQAKVTQEIAIAVRIENAEEVEIEEFYDSSGKGNIGLNVDKTAGSGSFGLGGEGRFVTKRIVRFKGKGDGTTLVSGSTAVAELQADR
ncbi:hypothetical protein [Azospirillum soli]|uniref:hypothetical protein n=1 Tax=Azospirillum soli TaxID=1304799 RepID=UPI001AE2423B|nr:hypothetical protein [Azospirillum soli]MBP2311902.1 hypothetical protein [Azospirillum soli]